MTRLLPVLVVASALLAGVAHAAVLATHTHLSCFKVKDPQAKQAYSANVFIVDGPPNLQDCTIRVPAKLVCRGTQKTITQGTPPGSFTATEELFETYTCYKLKCPKQSVVGTFSDQFGSRTMTLKAPNMICNPAPLT